MSKITLDTTDMTAIGNAIRTKLDVETPYKPGEMPAAILSIPGGITPTGTISIDSNGTFNVAQYASAEVNVQPTLQSKTATQNCMVTPDQGYDGLSSVLVNVSGGGGSVPALPAEYQEVEYLSVTGTQYINAGTINKYTLIEIKSMKTTSSTSEEGFAGDNGSLEFYYASGEIRFYSTSAEKLKLIDNRSASENISYKQFAVILNTTISDFKFGVYRPGLYPFTGRLYYLELRKISESNGYAPTSRYVPCYRKADNVAGFYEVYSGTFYTNAGSGSFGVGPDVQ